MRKGILALLLLAVGCASAPSAHHVDVRVTELRQPGQPTMSMGTHFYRIRVRNAGTEPFTVTGISVQPGGMTEADVENSSQRFNDLVNPGETVPFDMIVTVQVSRALMGSQGTIDSLRVVIMGEGPNGSFYETGDYSIGVDLGM